MNITPRLKTVSKIARLIDHQKEVIELQVQEMTHRVTLEKERLTVLEKALQKNIGRFELGLKDRALLNSEEVDYLFKMASTYFSKMEQKKRELIKIEKELEIQRALFWEAYKKKKAIETVQNKIVFQKRREEGILEQKNMDDLILSSRSRR